MGVDWICWMRTGDSKKKLKIKMKKFVGEEKKFYFHTLQKCFKKSRF